MVSELLGQLRPRKLLVVGDFMLDRYTIGNVRRISPEAPVPVLHVEREESRPGGAGNAILNLLALGQEVMAVGRIGDDQEGKLLRSQLHKAGADVDGLQSQSGYQTSVKNRFIAANQQIMRLDHEELKPLTQPVFDTVATSLAKWVQEVDAVAISDYGKGLLSPELLALIMSAAAKKGIPVIVDPKGRDFSRYRGATLLKPNQSEAYGASGLSDEASLEEIAARLLKSTAATYLMVTRSEEGISLFSKNARQDFSSQRREVRDVTGAGDTVLAVTTASLANGLPIESAAQLANAAAGIAVQRFGCARISLSDLAEA